MKVGDRVIFQGRGFVGAGKIIPWPFNFAQHTAWAVQWDDRPEPLWAHARDLAVVNEGFDVVCEQPGFMDHMTAAERKSYPMFEGALAYFPRAIAYLSHVSFVANEQHNPGEKLHWAKEKSIGVGNEILRHLVDKGKLDTDKLRHTGKLFWRAAELLERELMNDPNWK